MKQLIITFIYSLLIVLSQSARATSINYDAGVISVEGVQLFQDAEDSSKYYYLPQYPRLSKNEADEFELLLLKYTGSPNDKNGGIFHALIEFSLPEDVKEAVIDGLADIRPGATLVGALPLLEPGEDDPFGGFRVTSAVLSENGEVNNSVITSGPAPLLESSKAAIAARLDQEQATLLMDSLTGSTADISVSVRGYYLARVKGYNAIIKANMDTVYNHSSFVGNVQQQYTRRQIRDIADEMIQNGTISVEVFDQSEGLGIDSESMSKVTDLITNKLTELMFNTETGWSKQPTQEVAVAEGQIKDRLERGWFARTFLNAEDSPYYSDNQFVLKKREDVRSNSFLMNLSKTTTIRLPFDSTGNLGGFYSSITEDERSKYFRTLSIIDDIDMQQREVLFMIDAQVAKAFKESFNSVAINIRQKRSDDQATLTRNIIFDHASFDSNNPPKSIDLFRLGDPSDAWQEFEYQVAWSMQGMTDLVRDPKVQMQWNTSREGIISLVPPLTRKDFEVVVDTSDFSDKSIAAVEVQVAAIVSGEPHWVTKQLVRALDAVPSAKATFYHDQVGEMAYRLVWHTRNGRKATKFTPLEDDFLYLFSPTNEWLSEEL